MKTLNITRIYNVLNGDGHVRFIYPSQNLSAKVDIFDFSMDYVATVTSPIITNDQIEFIWNGINDYGKKVKNGVYFCRISSGGSEVWEKLMIINN